MADPINAPERELEVPDLSLVDTEHLAKEIARRYPEACIIYLEGEDEDDTYIRRFLRGKCSRLLGMTTRVRRSILRRTDPSDE